VTEPSTQANALLDSLVEIWRQELLVAVPGPDIDFIEVNGSSLVAVKMSVRIGELVGTRMLPALLYEYPTPREYAEFLANKNLQGN
jgi:hypothetical protein